jgi:hypothetical protein
MASLVVDVGKTRTERVGQFVLAVVIGGVWFLLVFMMWKSSAELA